MLAGVAIALTLGLSIIPPGDHDALGASLTMVRQTVGAGWARMAGGVDLALRLLE